MNGSWGRVATGRRNREFDCVLSWDIFLCDSSCFLLCVSQANRWLSSVTERGEQERDGFAQVAGQLRRWLFQNTTRSRLIGLRQRDHFERKR